MPSQSSVSAAFNRAEWDLLVRLPGQVVIAATSAEGYDGGRTVAEGLAGIDAIAAGRSSTNSLVRHVVETIYTEAGNDVSVANTFPDRSTGLAAALASCRAAGAVLTDRCTQDDRAAYRAWLESIATRVCDPSRSGAVPRAGGMQISPAERRFPADVSAALGG